MSAISSPSTKKSLSDHPNLAGLIARGNVGGRVVATRDHVLALDDFARLTSLGPELETLRGRSAVLSVGDMALAAAALIDLDGLARRIVLCPPGWTPGRLETVFRDAEAEAIVHDDDEAASLTPAAIRVRCKLPLRPRAAPRGDALDTEWILPTSGTTGPPKLVAHTLRGLLGAIVPTPLQQWATFYDIRRYGGLQIFLRALSGRGSLRLCGVDESVDAFLVRLGAAGVTHISGTPSHWRKALMSVEARRIDPDYVRLSGEIADDSVLAALRETYPRARVEHAYASTEAGVGFAVDDGKAGFPASLLGSEGPVRIRIEDGTLRLRSDRQALRFLGAGAPALADDEGFVDTGDLVERRGDRLYFLGRRGGIINVGGAKVHPEEVEAALNAHEKVRASRVFARANAITGALVMAEVVLREGEAAPPGLEREILGACRSRLPAYMVPARLRFVADLPMTAAGKLARDG
jgi:acyl-coenzyme A synthetase/AMP-(fatty) acid ligase